MFGGLDVKDLIELKLELQYAVQKTERAYSALLCQESREKNSRNYTAEQLRGGKLECEHAAFMLRAAAKSLLPTLEALALEEARIK